MSARYSDFVPYYDEYKHKVFSFLLYRLHGNRTLAEDLTSDTFVRAFEKFDTYNDQYAFSTWIYTIARNLLIDHIRKNQDLLEIEEAEHIEDDDAADATGAVDTKFKMDKVHDAMKTLPAFQKECIILKYVQELSTNEIAELTGESESNVRQALSRGLRKLQNKKFLFLCLLLFISSHFH